MKATRFFRYLWRINGILLFLGALLAIVGFGLMVILLVKLGPDESGPASRIWQATPPQEMPPTLEPFQSVTGTPFRRAALTFGDRHAGKSFSRSDGAGSTRNYLFFNPETLAGRWLFSDHRQLILDSDELMEPLQDKASYRTVAFFYRVIDTDTNGDGEVTPADNLSLAYSRPDGREYTVVSKGIDRVLDGSMTDNGKTHVVVYERDKKWCAVAISLRTFEVEKQGELPPR